MAALKTAASQECRLTYFFSVACKGQRVWSEFYNEDINKSHFYLGKKQNGRAENLCFGLVLTLDNYFLPDSLRFYVMNSYSRITTFGNTYVNGSLFLCSETCGF